MDVVGKIVLDYLVSQGPLGVVVAGMAYWIWKLQGQLIEVQNQRVKDAFRLVAAVHASASALERNTQTLKGLLED